MKCILILLFLYNISYTSEFAFQKENYNLKTYNSLLNDISLTDSMLDKKALDVYVKAYQFITQDSLFKNQTICVLNRLTGTAYDLFIDELKIDIKDFDATPLSAEDEKQDTTNVNWGELFCMKNAQCEYMLSFSRIDGNDLFAVIKMKKWFNTPLGETFVYFFRLNFDNTFQFVYRKELLGL